MMTSLKVFIPHNLLVTESGWLLGWQDVAARSICVIATINGNTSTVQDLATLCHRKDPNLNILGIWKNDCDASSSQINALDLCLEHWVILHRSDSDLPHCELKGKWPDSLKPTSIIFDARQIVNSCPLMSKITQENDSPTNVELVLKAVTSFSGVCQSLPDSYRERFKLFRHGNNSGRNTHRGEFCIQTCVSSDLYPIRSKNSWIIQILIMFSLRISQLWKRLPDFIQRLCSMLMVGDQLKVKCNQINDALFDTGGSPRALLRRKNVLHRFLFDICCGALLMAVLLQEDVTGQIAKVLMDWAEVVGDELSLLLKWLMGVPAGLKLNSHLDQLLGSFYLYHIYLWKGYLSILQPVFGKLLWYGALSGCLGLSMQLSLMSDLLSMLTLHIYCFYAYAARLYSLQIHTLASLWRLFIGKKQNPLRKRVDSASYDVDQLFIGTLLFTMLLFLLPTTGVYYIAFTTLRLVVIIINGCLSKMVSYINSLPVYSLIARGLHFAEMAGDLRIAAWPRCEGRPLCLSLQVIQSSFSEVYHLYKENGDPDTENTTSYTWGEFGNKLVTGKLVYPWISIRKEKQ